MTKRYDAVILGSGPDELVTAAYLGKAGKRVLVLESRESLGGVAVTEEFHPGFRANTLADGVQWIYPVISGDLDLKRHGLELIQPQAAVFAPSEDGKSLTLWRDVSRTFESIRKRSSHDASRFDEFNTAVTRLTRLMGTVYTMTPPDVVKANLLELMPFAQVALNLRGSGDRVLFDNLRALPMPMFDWLNEWFEDDLLKGVLAAGGVNALFQGPMAIGTVYAFLHHHVGLETGVYRAVAQVKGGLAKLAEALVSAAKAAKVEIRTGAQVARIVTDAGGRATGVALADGEEIEARTVVSGMDARQTFAQVDPREVDPVFLRKVRNIRFKGIRARVHLALGELPQFTGADRDSLHGTISISPDMKYLEWAYDDAKHARISEQPYLEASISTLNDPSLAPAGKHVMSVSFQFAPYHLAGGWNKKSEDQVLKLTIETMAKYAPNIKKAVEGSKVISPATMESDYGLTEGNLYQGEMALDQALFMRPVPGAGQYKMPIDGLWLCGPATHPGGALPGLPGYNAAREISRAL